MNASANKQPDHSAFFERPIAVPALGQAERALIDAYLLAGWRPTKILAFCARIRARQIVTGKVPGFQRKEVLAYLDFRAAAGLEPEDVPPGDVADPEADTPIYAEPDKFTP